MANPSTIMGAAALSWVDVDQGGMFQDTAGTTAAGVGDPVRFMPDGAGGGPYLHDGGTVGVPVLRDGYLEFDAAFLRKLVSRAAGPIAYGMRIRRVDEVADVQGPLIIGGTANEWYSGEWAAFFQNGFFNPDFWFGETNTGGTGGGPAGSIDVFQTLHQSISGGVNEFRLDGVSDTSQTTPNLGATARVWLGGKGEDFGTISANPGRFDVVRFYVLDEIPDSTQLAALEDWLENGDVGGAPEITGTLTAQETGSDAASASVDVVVSGSITAQESGVDGAAASVAVGIAAALAGQEAGSDLATATAAVGIEAALAAQEAGADSAAASAMVAVGITISAQETGPNLASGSAAVAIGSALAAQESGQDGASGSATVAVAGAMAAQEAGSDATAVSGAVAVAGMLAAQENGADRAVIQAGSGRIVSLVAQEVGSDQAEGSAAVEVAAALVAQEMGGDIASVIVSIEDNVITVNLAARETGPDVGSGAAFVAIAAAAFAQEQGVDGAEILSNVVILTSAALSETGTDRATIVVQNSVPIPSARRPATPAQSANGGRLTVKANGGRLIQSRNGGRLV